MKLNSIVRCQLMLVAALVAALFVTSSAFAQEEIERTTFADGPYVTNFAQTTQMTTAKTNDAITMDASNSAQVAATASDERAIEEAGMAQWTPIDSFSTIAMMLGFLGVVLYAIYDEKRKEQKNLCPAPLTPSSVTVR